MAIANKKHEKFYATTGTGADKIDSTKLTNIETAWDAEKADGCVKYIDDPILAPLLFQLQQMQDELDELRRYVTSNEMLVASAIGGAIPTSSKGLATGTLWNNRGLIAIV